MGYVEDEGLNWKDMYDQLAKVNREVVDRLERAEETLRAISTGMMSRTDMQEAAREALEIQDH